jgi:hypothetical protein
MRLSYATPRLFVSSAPVAAANSDPLSLKGMPHHAGAAYIMALAAKEKLSPLCVQIWPNR